MPVAEGRTAGAASDGAGPGAAAWVGAATGRCAAGNRKKHPSQEAETPGLRFLRFWENPESLTQPSCVLQLDLEHLHGSGDDHLAGPCPAPRQDLPPQGQMSGAKQWVTTLPVSHLDWYKNWSFKYESPFLPWREKKDHQEVIIMSFKVKTPRIKFIYENKSHNSVLKF